jgi:hypothetical protein
MVFIFYSFQKKTFYSSEQKISDETCVRAVRVVYYESLKRDLKTKPIYEFRCDERLKTKVEESTLLGYTQLVVELEHLKIETRLIDEMFESEMGEYVFLM